MATFPRQLKLYTERRANHNFLPSTVGCEEGASVSGATIGTLMSAISNLTESTRRSGTTRGGNNTTNPGGINKQQQQQLEDVTKEFREKHPERYGRDAINLDVQQDIKTVLTGMGEVNFYRVLGTNNKSWYQLKKSNKHSQGICPAFATGKCKMERCQALHLLGQETPNQWAQWLCGQIEPGCTRIKSGEDIQPRNKGRWGNNK